MRQRATLCLGICVCLTAGQVWAQHARQRFVRLEAGSLNPSDIFSTTLAVGASAGWQYADRDAVLVRYLRQSQNRAGTDVGKHAANFVTANWEHAFGTGGKYQRQALVRGGAGAVFRYLLHTAPVVDAGFEVRYGLATHWSLVANIEDDLAFLPHQVLQVCSFGSCSLITFDRKLEHNFGLIVAGEWRP